MEWFLFFESSKMKSLVIALLAAASLALIGWSHLCRKVHDWTSWDLLET
jgi:hypothetical protein